MNSAKTLFISSLFLFLAACTTAPAAEDAEAVAKREADFESQRLFEEAVLQETREREAAERELAEQQAVRELNNNAETEAQAEAEAQQRNAEPAADEAAPEVARQQTRAAELRRQIAANKAETEKLESSNAALSEAIAAAENLSRTLAAEQQKYNSTDPATGQPVDVLAKTRIEELKAQVERLRAQATALNQPAP